MSSETNVKLSKIIFKNLQSGTSYIESLPQGPEVLQAGLLLAGQKKISEHRVSPWKRE